MAPNRLQLLSLLLLAPCGATEASDAGAFSPAAICADVEPCAVGNSACVEHMLVGKHLRVFGVEYSPFGIYDSTQEGRAAWSGFDFEVLDSLASRLGFTYTVQHFA